jgi:ABC-type amino acid transport system permease subunit
MKWINAAGMLLQFLAFWFAAPELLGEKRLRSFEKGLKNLISYLPMILILLVIAVYGLTFGIGGIIKGIHASAEGIEASSLTSYYLVLSACTILYMVFILFFRRIHNWLERKVATPLSNHLINDQSARRSALILGAFLFTIGFICQFIIAIS